MCHRSLSFPFFWRDLSRILNKDFKRQLVSEFHLKAAKHTSRGVKLSKHPACWVNDGALRRQGVPWTAGREAAEFYLKVEA